MTMTRNEKLDWKVHAMGLLREIADSNPRLGRNLYQPMNMFRILLGEVAKRASELHDPKLDYLMMRLALYAVADPESPQYNRKIVEKYRLLSREQNRARIRRK